MSARARVAIDLVPIRAGRGGAGGGIWSYASALVRHLDRLAPQDLELVVLARHGQGVPDGLRHVRVERVDARVDGAGGRLRWVHRALPALCGRLGVDVLHKLATEVPAWLPGRTRLVTTVQDFMPEFYRQHLGGRTAHGMGRPLHRAYFAAVTRRAFAASDVVITTTEAVADEAAWRHPRAASRVTVVPLGIALDELSAVRRTADGGEGLRLLSVGAFLPHKGQLELLGALERLRVRHPATAARVTLTLRGHAVDAAHHAAVRAAAAPLGPRVRLAGYDERASVGALYADADLLVQLSAYEGFGLPLVEAQAAGVPVLCSDIPVFRGTLADGAWFVRRDDPDAVADAIAALAEDVAERDGLAARGRANARRFDWARTALGTAEVYRRVAGA